MGWYDDVMERAARNSKFLSTKQGMQYSFEIKDIKLVKTEKKFCIINKDYAIEITTTDGKVLSVSTVMGEICLRKLGSIFRDEQGEADPLIGKKFTYAHLSHSEISMSAGNWKVSVKYDRGTGQYDVKAEEVTDVGF